MARYVDWKKIGQGASANVFCAVDQEHGLGKVAIKLLKREYAADPSFMNSLRQEVMISRAIYHRDICPIYQIYQGPCPSEMGSEGDECVGIVMEFIDGGSDLKHWLKENADRICETIEERLFLLYQVAAALVVAHKHIVHRDLKPANIMLRQGDIRQPVLMDLGIALRGTEKAEIAGTPRYMAPEQYTAPEQVDHRADLFAFGIMAYEMFTGRTSPASLWDILNTGEVPRPRKEDIPPPSTFCKNLPKGLDEIILQLMEYDPDDRPQSAADILGPLEILIPGKSRYANWEKIGEGASAMVYRATDQKHGLGQVAIKLLRHDFVSDPSFLESLRQEVVISHKIYHRDICPIYGIYEGPCPSGMSGAQGSCLGIVMQLIEGGSDLKHWIDQNKQRLRDTAGDRLRLLCAVAEALVIAHKHIVHRDLKPANIMLRQGDIGQPVIMDLGIALLGAKQDQIAGTPRYMAPEQYTSPECVGPAADLFAFGIMAYEMFTGVTPPTSLAKSPVRLFGEDGYPTGASPPRPRREEITPPSAYLAGLPRVLDEIILQLMAYEPEDRPRSAADVLSLLKSVEQPPWPIPPAPDELAWVSFPGGVYMIGASPSDTLANEHEIPRREVRISPFQMTVYPITNANYRQFLQRTGHRRPLGFPDDPSRDAYPVVGVSWSDAKAFAQSVGGELPTEAQWEYAARNGEKIAQGSVYPWGKDDRKPLTVRANIGTGSLSRVTDYPEGKTLRGIYDLCGNVWEWCLDVWSPKYYDALTKGMVDPVHEPIEEVGKGARMAKEGKERKVRDRSLRGGSYDSMPSQARCTARFYAPENSQWPSVGFRVVKKV